MRQFLLQMTGEPGAGKSTLATEIGRATSAVVIDKDILKSRLLVGDDAGTPVRGLSEAVAAPMHYALLFDLARSFLRQGFSVVIDGAAFFPLVRERGAELAAGVGAPYFIIECVLSDVGERQRRIDSKVRMASHVSSAVFSGYSRPGTAVLTEAHLTLDTSGPLESYLLTALEYIGHDLR